MHTSISVESALADVRNILFFGKLTVSKELEPAFIVSSLRPDASPTSNYSDDPLSRYCSQQSGNVQNQDSPLIWEMRSLSILSKTKMRLQHANQDNTKPWM